MEKLLWKLIFLFVVVISFGIFCEKEFLRFLPAKMQRAFFFFDRLKYCFKIFRLFEPVNIMYTQITGRTYNRNCDTKSDALPYQILKISFHLKSVFTFEECVCVCVCPSNRIHWRKKKTHCILGTVDNGIWSYSII